MSTAYSNTRPAVALAEALTLPQRCYSDPEWFQREIESIHSDMWLCAGRANQIPNAGDYFVRRVVNASIIITRDEQGGIRTFHNVCRHRGTLLCKDDEGKFAGRIQCQYHAWTYRLDGTLANAPHMEKVQGFCEADYPLKTIATALWDGHIFFNFSAHPIPFAQHISLGWTRNSARGGWKSFRWSTGVFTNSKPTGNWFSRITPSACTARSFILYCRSNRIT